MVNYLFLVVDRYDASESKTLHVRSNLEPKLVFRTAFLEYLGEEDEGAEEYYEDVVKEDVVVKEGMITYDEGEVTFLLIKLDGLNKIACR
jgi:hypothetical protein